MEVPFLDCEGAQVDFLGIDDLLDFSNDDIAQPIESSLTIASSNSIAPSIDASYASSQDTPPANKGSSSQHPHSVFDSGELCVPCDDLAELEWLSNFVEESFSSADHATASFCVGIQEKPATKDSHSYRKLSAKDCLQRTSPTVLESTARSRDVPRGATHSADMSIPGRARSKRSRASVCFWNTQIISADASESLLNCSPTASTITADSDVNDTYYNQDDDDNYEEDEDEDDDDDDFFDDRMLCYQQYKRPYSGASPLKKKRKKYSKSRKFTVQDEGQEPQKLEPRKCLHCGSTKTPQWRAGPMGPKTLCNACGVRYKSGRLCAEYRPAASPTFIENVHSNSHRKVMEIRRQRGELAPLLSSIPRTNSQAHCHFLSED
ncbi:hypothetical protein KP509_07G000700 [Ceratopteris richardii]|uniref:GATA transcription factor n=1 Tax=Ceratopteris richardii TaxID=49495 RepID=A0A8T2UF97_CERRI|nr:hypothetical protein KP509_07G000700 [Ceratopteris richardii]